MTNLNMNYFWIRIRVFFANRDPVLEEIQKLLNRCLKLYACINDIMKIFKLIEKFRKAKGKDDLENATEYQKKSLISVSRKLYIAINMLV